MKNIILLLSITLLISSCERSTYGCIDPYAVNYESYADYDNGSCSYTADVVFYLDVAGALYFTHVEEIQELWIYVEGVEVDYLDASIGFNYIPLCYPIDGDAVNFSYSWDNDLAATFTWVIVDEYDVVHYEGTDVIGANDCLPMELTFKKIQEYKASK
jgi:hypothetical protein